MVAAAEEAAVADSGSDSGRIRVWGTEEEGVVGWRICAIGDEISGWRILVSFRRWKEWEGRRRKKKKKKKIG